MIKIVRRRELLLHKFISYCSELQLIDIKYFITTHFVVSLGYFVRQTGLQLELFELCKNPPRHQLTPAVKKRH
jgi:hypothetical protein